GKGKEKIAISATAKKRLPAPIPHEADLHFSPEGGCFASSASAREPLPGPRPRARGLLATRFPFRFQVGQQLLEVRTTAEGSKIVIGLHVLHIPEPLLDCLP